MVAQEDNTLGKAEVGFPVEEDINQASDHENFKARFPMDITDMDVAACLDRAVITTDPMAVVDMVDIIVVCIEVAVAEAAVAACQPRSISPSSKTLPLKWTP